MVKVHLITQSSNNLNLTLVVDEVAADGLVPTLHAALIKCERRADDPAVSGRPGRAVPAGPAAVAAPRWTQRRETLLRLSQRRPRALALTSPPLRARVHDLRPRQRGRLVVR